jgi:hypothetical protein
MTSQVLALRKGVSPYQENLNQDCSIVNTWALLSVEPSLLCWSALHHAINAEKRCSEKVEIRPVRRKATCREAIDWAPPKQKRKNVVEATACRMNNLAATFLRVFRVSFYRFETRASDSFRVVEIKLDRDKTLNDRKAGIRARFPRPQVALIFYD